MRGGGWDTVQLFDWESPVEKRQLIKPGLAQIQGSRLVFLASRVLATDTLDVIVVLLQRHWESGSKRGRFDRAYVASC